MLKIFVSLICFLLVKNSLAINVCDLVKPCLNKGECNPVKGSDDYICVCKQGYSGRVCENYSNLPFSFSRNETVNVKPTHGLNNNRNLTTPLLSKDNNITKPFKEIKIMAPTLTNTKPTNHTDTSFNANKTQNENHHSKNSTELINESSTILIETSAGKDNVKKSQGCESTNCNNGLCLPKPTGSVCLCLDGWKGEFCDIKVSANCEPGCQNGGICAAGKCLCLPSFTGPFCGQATSKCDLPCQNDGVCSAGKCVCLSSFTGPQCGSINEAIVPRCSSNICHNGGTCYQLKKNQLRCLCKQQNYGQYCQEVN